MRIIAHRGYWREGIDKNSEKAFCRAVDCGFGIETDFRDFLGELVISHDPPVRRGMALEQFLDRFTCDMPLALNVKADGLASEAANIMRNRAASDVFFFDMSIPDMRAYILEGLPIFGRVSEVERELSWPESCAGLWVDAFNYEWFDNSYLLRALDSGKKLCLVSPELHGRDHRPLWDMLSSNVEIVKSASVMICTDYPQVAEKVFGGT